MKHICGYPGCDEEVEYVTTWRSGLWMHVYNGSSFSPVPERHDANTYCGAPFGSTGS